MRKLILKISLFTFPFIILYYIQDIYYINDKGDLFRLGYFGNDENYNSSKLFKNENIRKWHYKKISEINPKTNYTFDILTIGDSFSEIGSVGYQDYLSELSKKKTLHYDKFLNENPLETLNSLANGDFFERIKIKYVILESVERECISRSTNLNTNKKVYLDSITLLIQKNNTEIKLAKNKKHKSSQEQFFSRTLIRFPLYSFCYIFDDNAFFSPTYKVALNKNMFSANENNLLFYDEDLKQKATLLEVENFNNGINELANKLAKKGIQLIFLPCPNKFNVYYENIVNNSKYAKPLFFDLLKNLPKKYIYIESDKLLKEAIMKEKDIYYYDDTHWSPKAAKIIAKEISKKISATNQSNF